MFTLKGAEGICGNYVNNFGFNFLIHSFFQIIFCCFLFCVFSHVHQTITISHILSEEEKEEEEEGRISNQQPIQYPFLEGFPTTENSWFPGLVILLFFCFIFIFLLIFEWMDRICLADCLL